MKLTCPDTLAELQSRAMALRGLSFGDLANILDILCPSDILHAKGWLGQAIEHYLGADAGNAACPDFTKLGVELKTLPLSVNAQVLESTYVCHVPSQRECLLPFKDSSVAKKLSCVLWVTIQGERDIPFASRCIGEAFLWQPHPTQWKELSEDWEELAGFISRGEFSAIQGHLGSALQIRPKAAHGQIYQQVYVESDIGETLPRGFYLRAAFTQRLLWQG